ncbi:hypothetical protein ACFVHS_25155 [Streptomyces sp. NPDC057746]|uniref:hypothetical protein n=1 Tax=Streptomyces sp. NPDC057746 TaxID=3346237 RepID=UPI0036976929
MTTDASPELLVPTGDPRPVERAAVDSILDGFDPEMFVSFAFHRPDGGCHIWHAWTDRGPALGDHVDELALAAGMDAADWLHIGDRHSLISTRGRIRIEAYPLRPLLADVRAGERSPEQRRDALRRVLEAAAAEYGRIAPPGLPRWIGYGPTLVNRKDQSQ